MTGEHILDSSFYVIVETYEDSHEMNTNNTLVRRKILLQSETKASLQLIYYLRAVDYKRLITLLS